MLHFLNQLSFLAGVMTFFFALHLFFRGKLDICGRDDPFFALHLILRGKLDISGFFYFWEIYLFFFEQMAIIFFHFFC